MKKVLFLVSLLVVGLLVTSCHINVKKSISVDEPTITVENELKDYERVVVEAACNVKFIQSDVSKLKMKGAQSDLKRVSYDVEDGVLYVRYGERKGVRMLKLRDMGAVDVELYSPDLIGIELRGAGEVNVEDLDTDTLTLDMRGAGNIRMKNIICDRIEAQLKGAGEISIDELETEWADIQLKGVGNVDVGFVNSGYAKCSLQGVGNVKLHGQVRKLDRESKGTGNVDVSELKVGE
ncbi:MAG: DUF2807 domain-containing protein [Prevotella sp.]|nr:DUF2807 domain-containing protein [Prevotella sp.]